MKKNLAKAQNSQSKKKSLKGRTKSAQKMAQRNEKTVVDLHWMIREEI